MFPRENCITYVILYRQGRPQDLAGVGKYFFPDLEICMSRSDMLHMAKPCALLGGVWGHTHEKIF